MKTKIEPKRYVNIYKDDPSGRFISDIDYESLEELEAVMEYRIDKEFVIDTVRLVSKEEDVQIAEWKRDSDALGKLSKELDEAHRNLVSISLTRAFSDIDKNLVGVRSANGRYYTAPSLVEAIEKIG